MKTEEEQMAFDSKVKEIEQELEWLTELTPSQDVLIAQQVLLAKLNELRNNYIK